MNDYEEIKTNLFMELRKGTISLSVLSQLSEPKYGYSLVETLAQKGIRVEPGTLYPLLRRMEKQELLESNWETAGSKPRKYYVLSEIGANVYKELTAEWALTQKTMNELINKEEKSNGK